jgi:hypothetical protein
MRATIHSSMTRGTAAGIAIGAAIAACFSAPTRPGAPDDSAVSSDGIRMIDAPGTGVDAYEPDAMPGCVLESFSAPGTDCGSWAQTTTTGVGTVGRASSLLYLGFNGSGTGSASCRAVPKALDRVTFDMKGVVASPAGDSTFVGFVASNGSAYGLEFRWEAQNSAIGMALHCPGVSALSPLPTWDPVANRYVRVARDSSINAQVQVGSNTSSFTTTLGMCPRTTQFNAAEITTVAYRPGSAAAGSAQLESLEYCVQ